MDIYEFTQALRRQWKLLLVGLLGLLLAVFAALFELTRIDGDLSIQERIDPKYESSVEMVVVPEGLESLASRGVASGFAGQAQVYAQLLNTTEAARQIEDMQGIELIDTLISRSSDSFINVTAISPTPEGAVSGAIGAFRWLEMRLAEPPMVAVLPGPEPIDTEGPFLGHLLVDVDRLYANAEPDLTLVVANSQGDEVAVTVRAAAGESLPQLINLEPESLLFVSIEREVGVPLDTVTIEVPPLPETAPAPPPLVLRLAWGGIEVGEVDGEQELTDQTGDVDSQAAGGDAGEANVQLDSGRMSMRWDTRVAVQEERVSLLLITEEPIVLPSGQRRTPVLTAAILGVGLLALLALAATVDSWQREKSARRGLDQSDAATRGPRGLHLALSEPDPTSELPHPEVPRAEESSESHRPRSSSP